ncbi:hypothetical protein Tco_0703929 [Tanacetum coccineum]|uniref:Uncharacterized protein n=1 Tax=Tanacetum coccineum TaxID=301880 RepID=A0ABQ4Y272_9ASTR
MSITSSNIPKSSDTEDYTLPNQDTNKVPSNESQRNTTDPSVVVSDSLATDYDSGNESSVYSTPLLSLKKLDSVEPIFGPKTIKLILKSKSTFKAETLKGITINEPSSAPARCKSSSASKTNSALAGSSKCTSKQIQNSIQISKKKSSYSRNKNAQQCKRTNHRTCDHAEFMSSMNANQHHTGQDHNEIEWFGKRETLQAKNAESFKASKNDSSNALSSKTPTKRSLNSSSPNGSEYSNGVHSNKLGLDLNCKAICETQLRDYALWDVIKNGNSFKPVPQTTTNADRTSTTLILGPITTEEKVQKKNYVKAKNMLLMALPNEHLMTFNQYKDAKTFAPSIESLDSIFNMLQKIVSQLAILGENISQEHLNLKFLRSLPSEWNTHVVVWRNKPDLDTMSFDDLYNNFKIVEQEVKGTASSSSSSSSQNMAFVSSSSSTNEVNTAYGVSTANTQVSPVSTQVSTASTQVSTTNLSDDTVYAFLASQPNGSQLVYEDHKQIHEDDIEEMDLKWQLALLSMRTRSYMVDDEVPTNMTLMDFLDSKVVWGGGGGVWGECGCALVGVVGWGVGGVGCVGGAVFVAVVGVVAGLLVRVVVVVVYGWGVSGVFAIPSLDHFVEIPSGESKIQRKNLRLKGGKSQDDPHYVFSTRTGLLLLQQRKTLQGRTSGRNKHYKLNTGIEQASTVGEDKGPKRRESSIMLSEENTKEVKEQNLQEEASLAKQ